MTTSSGLPPLADDGDARGRDAVEQDEHHAVAQHGLRKGVEAGHLVALTDGLFRLPHLQGGPHPLAKYLDELLEGHLHQGALRRLVLMDHQLGGHVVVVPPAHDDRSVDLFLLDGPPGFVGRQVSADDDVWRRRVGLHLRFARRRFGLAGPEV